MAQTAIEWFYKQLYGTPRTIWEEELNQIREQADQMFKEQIMKTYRDGRICIRPLDVMIEEEYYKETYGK